MSIRKIDDDIRNRYPYPLSGTFHRAYYDTRDIALIHDYLFDLYEVTLKYLTACILAQYVQDGAPDAGINASLLNLQRPSLGHWQSWLRDIIKFYQKQKLPLLMPEIAQVYDQKSSGEMYKAFLSLRTMMVEQMAFKGDGKNYQQITTQQFFDLLGQYRNKVAHGAKLNVYDRKQVVEWLLPAMRELFVALSFTAEYRLLFINEVKLAGTRREMTYEHFITDLTGYRPGIVNDPFITPTPSGRPEELYVSAKGADFAPIISLHPFIIYTFCKDCSTEQTFVLNQSRDDTLTYLSYQCSHQFSLRDYLDDIETILGALRAVAPATRTNVPIGPAIVPAEPLAAEEVERRERRATEQVAERNRREVEDQQQSVVEKNLEGRQQSLDAQLLAQQNLLADERRKLDEERRRVAAELETLRQEQEAREKRRLEDDARAQQEEARRRSAAGAAQAIVCPNCRRLNPPGKKFCSNCGVGLAAAPTINTQQPQQPQQQPQTGWQQQPYQGQYPNQNTGNGQPNRQGYTQPGYQPNQSGYNQPPNQQRGQGQVWPNNQPQPGRQPSQQPQPIHQPTQQPQAPQQPVAAAEGSKTCPKCGQLNPGARKFCTHCGFSLVSTPLNTGASPPAAQKTAQTAPLAAQTGPLPQQPPQTGPLTPPSAQTAQTGPLAQPQAPTASATAAVEEKVCPTCGRTNPAARRFCTGCGNNLTDVPLKSATPAPGAVATGPAANPSLGMGETQAASSNGENRLPGVLPGVPSAPENGSTPAPAESATESAPTAKDVVAEAPATANGSLEPEPVVPADDDAEESESSSFVIITDEQSKA